MSFLLLGCLCEVALQQVHKHSYIHDKLDKAYGGNSVVHIQEATNRRSHCTKKRLGGCTQPQHRA